MSPEPTFRDFGILHRLTAYLRGRPSCTYLTSWPYTLQGIPSASEGSPSRLGKLTGTGRRPCPFSGHPCLVLFPCPWQVGRQRRSHLPPYTGGGLTRLLVGSVLGKIFHEDALSLTAMVGQVMPGLLKGVG